VNTGFPIFAIERLDFHAVYTGIIQATRVHTDTIRMGSGNIKGFDTTGPAKQVFRLVRSEGIGLKGILTGNQVKIGFCHDQV